MRVSTVVATAAVRQSSPCRAGGQHLGGPPGTDDHHVAAAGERAATRVDGVADGGVENPHRPGGSGERRPADFVLLNVCRSQP
ncbi:hypothetical protein ACFPM0_01150 [Pseudonocardia sulfidoxydans]|uniref:hypothetical protein n=1 Tax=Pseudonocardia sulfidoxydans TaxID=54011 RepID=UPI003607551F